MNQFITHMHTHSLLKHKEHQDKRVHSTRYKFPLRARYLEGEEGAAFHTRWGEGGGGGGAGSGAVCYHYLVTQPHPLIGMKDLLMYAALNPHEFGIL